MFRPDPNNAECWKFSWYGCEAGAGGSIHSNWVENRASVALTGPEPRYHVVLELFGMDITILVQIECAMHGCHQGVGTGCAEQNQAGIPAPCKNELAVTSDGNRGNARVASDSTSECGFLELMGFSARLRRNRTGVYSPAVPL